MKRLALTLPTPAENLALDEALVESADRALFHPEVLRLWEPQQTFVVLGRSSSLAKEVNVPWCQSNGIKMFRRTSGGASIVTGPGCLMYAVLLDLRKRPQLRMLDQAHQFVMETMLGALTALGVASDIQGTCDLTIRDRKVSGNSLRVKKNFLIYHGTMICDFDTTLISQCLRMPARQPDYRSNRSHDQFISRIPCNTSVLSTAITSAWQANESLAEWPKEMTQQLAKEKYRDESWLKRVE